MAELELVKTADDPLVMLKSILTNYKSSLESIGKSIKYENGQVDLAIAQLNIQLSKINSYSEEQDINAFMEERFYEIEAFIVHPIQMLNAFLELAYEEEDAQTGLILYLTTTIYQDFFIYLNTVKNLTELLTDSYFTRERISGIITYTRTGYQYVVLLKELNNMVNSTYNDAMLDSVVQKYVETTKDFQEYLITNTVNNFNRVDTAEMQYEKIKYCRGAYNYYHDKTTGNFWTYSIEESPQLLTFWFDFLDADKSELADIASSTIGNRIKVVTDKNVKAINYKDIPQVIFKRVNDKNFERKVGYTYININNNTESFFRTSSKSKSAKERVEELLYDHSYCADNVTISAIPVYHLEPNYHILIRDDKSNIDGEYIITKMTIPLNYKKTMNITASKAVTNIV